MTLKDALIKSLEDLDRPVNYMEVYNHLAERGYYDFGTAKTPSDTVGALLGNFIRNGDGRVSRMKQDGGAYLYFLTKNVSRIEADAFAAESKAEVKNNGRKKEYLERSLHKLLASYLLRTNNIHAKTIFHEQSKTSVGNQTWTHPDMVGVAFRDMRSKAGKNLLKMVNRMEFFKISSFELKREINSDSELKQAYFQAVSNSSWANYGYLVAFDFGENLSDEISRLNQSFGIGVIKLSAYPYESKVLYPARYRELDFKTIDKLCNMNKDFEKFIEQVEKLMSAEDRYYMSTKRELEEFCDDCFESDEEIEKYCAEQYIPFAQDKNENN